MRFSLHPGVAVEPLGDGWVAFSPASGDTMLINDESAAILEILAEGPARREAVCALLAEDTGLSAAEIEQASGDAWILLAESGLIRTVSDVEPVPAGRRPA